jgi:hypothetical protein
MEVCDYDLQIRVLQQPLLPARGVRKRSLAVYSKQGNIHP